MLCSVVEHGITPFRFRTARKNSVPLLSSVWQFENSVELYYALQTNLKFSRSIATSCWCIVADIPKTRINDQIGKILVIL